MERARECITGSKTYYSGKRQGEMYRETEIDKERERERERREREREREENVMMKKKTTQSE